MKRVNSCFMCIFYRSMSEENYQNAFHSLFEQTEFMYTNTCIDIMDVQIYVFFVTKFQSKSIAALSSHGCSFSLLSLTGGRRER